ncbi:DUF1735 domain-containing protein [Rudanella paleaurantiibacter]|uniref:DUF1735 domain-containing protein n=1 Tax=Rudanella paleaurantiibacter TaxID=2614655 RepID=A0A7J5U4V6_9BACT|nr:DUF1735 domain-containing protein [Rudanella paleaurantiibacter]
MKKYFNILLVFALGLVLTSCLKDTITLDPDKSTNVIEFKNPSSFVSPYGSKYALYTKAFDLAPENSYTVTVSYSGAQVAPEDIAVTLGIDEPAIKQYNTEQSTAYELIPASLYTLPTSATIRKGERTADVVLKFKSNNFDFSKNYVLPLQIKSASTGTVSGNFGTILLSVNAKNKYDGVYTVKGTMVDVTNAAFKHLTEVGQPLEYSLETISATKCAIVDREYGIGAPAHVFWTGTGISYYGSFGGVVEFDPATDKIVAVTNFYGQPAGNTRSARLDPSGANKYDPAAKTISLNYFMVQPSVVAAAPNVRTTWKETLTFSHPR